MSARQLRGLVATVTADSEWVADIVHIIPVSHIEMIQIKYDSLQQISILRVTAPVLSLCGRLAR